MAHMDEIEAPNSRYNGLIEKYKSSKRPKMSTGTPEINM